MCAIDLVGNRAPQGGGSESMNYPSTESTPLQVAVAVVTGFSTCTKKNMRSIVVFYAKLRLHFCRSHRSLVLTFFFHIFMLFG